jgi:CheY-like chemotaxis protein
MKALRHPPSKELWRFCMERLRELRGPDTRERDLANILGFEHSRAVRWKEGQMYVDRAEYLVRLADAIDVEPMLLVAMASGSLSVEQAHRQITNNHGRDGDGKRRRSPTRTEPLEVAADASTFALDSSRFEAGGRGVVLLVAGNGEGRADLGKALSRHPDVSGLVATGVSIGLVLAERYRPELVFLDLGVANVHAFDACRAFSSLTSRAGRRCRVVAGTTNVTDAVEKPALMAGAASVALFPFAPNVFESELDRLEERLGPRKVARRS